MRTRLDERLLSWLRVAFDHPLSTSLQVAVPLVYPLLLVIAIVCAILSVGREINHLPYGVLSYMEGVGFLAIVVSVHLSYWLLFGKDNIYDKPAKLLKVKHIAFPAALTVAYVLNVTPYYELSKIVFGISYFTMFFVEFAEVRHDRRTHHLSTPGTVMRSRIWMIVDFVIWVALLLFAIITNWPGLYSRSVIQDLANSCPLTVKDVIIFVNLTGYIFVIWAVPGALRCGYALNYAAFMRKMESLELLPDDVKYASAAKTAIETLSRRPDGSRRSIRIIDLGAGIGNRSLATLRLIGFPIDSLDAIEIERIYHPNYRQNANLFLPNLPRDKVNVMPTNLRAYRPIRQGDELVVFVISHLLHDRDIAGWLDDIIRFAEMHYDNFLILLLGAEYNSMFHYLMQESATSIPYKGLDRWNGARVRELIGMREMDNLVDEPSPALFHGRLLRFDAESVRAFSFWSEAIYGHVIGSRTLRVLDNAVMHNKIEVIRFDDAVYLFKGTRTCHGAFQYEFLHRGKAKNGSVVEPGSWKLLQRRS